MEIYSLVSLESSRADTMVLADYAVTIMLSNASTGLSKCEHNDKYVT